MGGNILRVFAIFVVLMLLGAIGFFICAKQPAIARVSPPAASDFDQTTIAKGAMLASMGYCAECHTAQGGAAFAGGYPVPTPFGTIYGSNITPDPQTGIGNWSQAAFLRAMHEGVAQNGAYLYPAFPYNHFTLVSDNDAKAIYAYLMTRQPVHNVVPAPKLPFPLNIRLVLAGWNLLFCMRAASSQTRPRVPRGIAAPISPRASATALPATRRITRSVQKWAPPRMPAARARAGSPPP